jgi:alkylhydroperoxidase family enzyme
MRCSLGFAIAFLGTCTTVCWAEQIVSHEPKPIPATRPEIKEALEALKDREPRLPLPAPSDGEPSVNNGRMRAAYLPETWASGGSRPRQPGPRRRGAWADPNAKLDHGLTRAAFWVVSRGNNCHYCLGHQELALLHTGYDDDRIAAIDCDWSVFDPRHQAALEFARKLTLEPQLVCDGDLVKLKEVFSDAEIIELAYNIARFNATNRWTDGLGLPQDRRFGDEANAFISPTSEKFQNAVSIVSPTTRAARPPLPTHDDVRRALADCRQRKPRVKLPSEEEAAKAFAKVVQDRAPVVWERALAQLPETGAAQVAAMNAVFSDEHLSARLKAEIALISAIHNRAWYAVGIAVQRLRRQGVSPEEMVALFDVSGPVSTGAAAAHRLAKKSTVDPHLITDADIAVVREHYSDPETAQIVQVICMANLFDRFTEALSLPLEE